MDKEEDSAQNKLPLNTELSFEQLYGRLPSDAARLRLWKMKELFALELRDPLWGVILALEQNISLSETLPDDLKAISLSLSASFKQALEDFTGENQILHRDLEILGERLLGELIQDIAANVGLGVKTSTQELTEKLDMLMRYLKEGKYREAILEPVRLDVQKMAGEFNTEMVSTIQKAGNEAVAKVQEAVPIAKREGILIGVVSVVLLVLIALNLTLALVTNYTWDMSGKAVLDKQEYRQIQFAAGLDKNTRRLMELHNSHLPLDQQLRLH